jgi:hypothetical protein
LYPSTHRVRDTGSASGGEKFEIGRSSNFKFPKSSA